VGQPLDLLGQTSPQLIKRYVVRVPTNQVMTVNLVEGDVSLNVQYPNGQVERNASGVKFLLPGDYRVDVLAQQQTSFRLNIGVQNAQ
jgi:hypothetical protein